MRGRPPKPTSQKRLQGTARPDRINADEPEPESGIPEPVGLIGEYAEWMWEHITPILESMGVLTLADGMALTNYCNAYGRMRDAEEFMAKYGMTQTNDRTGIDSKRPEVFIQKEAAEMMDKIGAKFGLTPSDRTRIKAERPKANPSEDFLFKKREPKKPQLEIAK